ncbi:hypothetical protein LEP1GSC188_4974 [Leptospira weilii serovar Topaz str. LT2116]|uniref:Uncharacterized protein n=1 Tax=Leptospira weilii serovar Topaz str. LT2116 TaxID=1088540 RepID=M3EKF7_9LEPT|nr:hypothetical protein LEP1GSC188_4974 [Leptospira weilii serovar Topaz str. LT2116]
MVLGLHSCRKETIGMKLVPNYAGFSFKSWFWGQKKLILIDPLA